jgi:hypothetical protein
MRLLLIFATIATVLAWTVISDADILGFGIPAPAHKTSSAEACADICKTLHNCVAVVWNGPKSLAHDGNCNWKCSSEHQSHDGGEELIIVQEGKDCCKDTCNEACTNAIPIEWLAREAAGNVVLAHGDVNGPLPNFGNGYVAAHSTCRL